MPEVRSRALKCVFCGYEAPALKTIHFRGGVHRHTCCNRCWKELEGVALITKGRLPVWGQCRVCGEWRSMNDLRETVGGGRWDSFIGTCVNCSQEGAR